jgi:hypothetical protein
MLLTATLGSLDAMPLTSHKTGLRRGDRRPPAEAGHTSVIATPREQWALGRPAHGTRRHRPVVLPRLHPRHPATPAPGPWLTRARYPSTSRACPRWRPTSATFVVPSSPHSGRKYARSAARYWITSTRVCASAATSRAPASRSPGTRLGATMARLLRSRLSSLRSPPQWRPSGPSQAIGYTRPLTRRPLARDWAATRKSGEEQ